MTKTRYLDIGAFLDPPNVVGLMMWLRLYLQMIHKYSRQDVLVASIVDNKVAYLSLTEHLK